MPLVSGFLHPLNGLLAEFSSGAGAEPPRPPRPIRFSDLQKSMRDQFSGNTNDTHYSYILWAIVAAIILFGVFLHLRQRRKTGGPPNNPATLFREIARGVPFPFGTRLLLHWVARTAQVPAATLLISDQIFQKSVEEWAQQPTFAILRQWGVARLTRLHQLLFGNA